MDNCEILMSEKPTTESDHPGVHVSESGVYYHCPACTKVFATERDALEHVFYGEYRDIKAEFEDH